VPTKLLQGMTNNVGPKHKKWTIFDPGMHLVQVKFALVGVVGTLCENAGEPRGSMQPFFPLSSSRLRFRSLGVGAEDLMLGLGPLSPLCGHNLMPLGFGACRGLG
jgi:hypothetical protein